MDGNKNANGHTIQLFESKDVTKIKEAPGYHFCKNESGTHLAPVPDVSLSENRLNIIETIKAFQISRIDWTGLCGENSSPYVPASKYEFEEALESFNLSDLNYPSRSG